MTPVAFATCGLIWGSTFLAIRTGDDALPPVWAATLRLILAVVLLHALMFATKQRWPKGEMMRAAALYGFFEFGIQFPLLYWGEHLVSSGISAAIYAIAPVLAILLTRAFGLEELNLRRLGAAVFAVGGIGIIFWRETSRAVLPSVWASSSWLR